MSDRAPNPAPSCGCRSADEHAMAAEAFSPDAYTAPAPAPPEWHAGTNVCADCRFIVAEWLRDCAAAAEEGSQIADRLLLACPRCGRNVVEVRGPQ